MRTCIVGLHAEKSDAHPWERRAESRDVAAHKTPRSGEAWVISRHLHTHSLNHCGRGGLDDRPNMYDGLVHAKRVQGCTKPDESD